MDCSPPGSSVHGILQARILEWVAMPFPRGSSHSRDGTWVSCLAGRCFTKGATREGPHAPLVFPFINILHQRGSLCSRVSIDALLLTEVTVHLRVQSLGCTFPGFGFCPLRTQTLAILWMWSSPYPLPPQHLPLIMCVCYVIFLMKETPFWYSCLEQTRKWKREKPHASRKQMSKHKEMKDRKSLMLPENGEGYHVASPASATYTAQRVWGAQ